MTLSPHPRGRIVAPLVSVIGQAPESGFDVIPAPFVLETTPDEFGDERASPPRARSPDDLGHEIVVECYVQTHARES